MWGFHGNLDHPPPPKSPSLEKNNWKTVPLIAGGGHYDPFQLRVKNIDKKDECLTKELLDYSAILENIQLFTYLREIL